MNSPAYTKLGRTGPDAVGLAGHVLAGCLFELEEKLIARDRKREALEQAEAEVKKLEAEIHTARTRLAQAVGAATAYIPDPGPLGLHLDETGAQR